MNSNIVGNIAYWSSASLSALLAVVTVDTAQRWVAVAQVIVIGGIGIFIYARTAIEKANKTSLLAQIDEKNHKVEALQAQVSELKTKIVCQSQTGCPLSISKSTQSTQ